MPYGLNNIRGGTKRFFYSAAPEGTTVAGWGATPATLDRVLHPSAGYVPIGSAEYELLENANSAQGQGERASRLTKGSHKKIAPVEFWFTPEAMNRLMSSLGGSDTMATIETTGRSHTIAPTTAPVPFSIEEHLLGSAYTTLAAGYAGVWCQNVRFGWSKAAPFATCGADLVLSRVSSTAVSDLSGTDATENQPNDAGFHPTKFRLFIAPTTGNEHTSAFDGTFGVPTTQGIGWASDLTNGNEIGLYCDSVNVEIMSGVDLDDTMRAGFSSGSGSGYGKPFALDRNARITLNCDALSTAMMAGFQNYFATFADASQQSHTIEICAVGDTLVGTTYYGAVGIVFHACRIDSIVKPDAGLGLSKMSISFSLVQPSTGNLWDYIGYDDIDQDYA